MANILQKEINPKDLLKKKQWSKYVSRGIALSLMHFNPNSPLFKSYKNSTYCVDTILFNENGKSKSTYCKNRWCFVCNRIKTARLINSYLPQLQNLDHPVFVTLTLPTVLAEDLPTRINFMEKMWRKIYKLSHKSKFKKQYIIFKGIRKAECTIRPDGKYHYHFHFIINDWATGEWLIRQWLKYNPEASPLAQDLRFADEFSFKELFKYAFKAEVKLNNRASAERYDVVFRALRGKRTYQAFGGIKAIEEDFTDEDLNGQILLEGMADRIFKWVQADWYNTSTGEALVNLPIPDKIKNMVGYPDTS